MKLTYIKSACYVEDVHKGWMYLFHHLDGLQVTAVNADETAVEFIPTNEDAKAFVQLMNDCDLGTIMTEEQRRDYEEEEGPLF